MIHRYLKFKNFKMTIEKIFEVREEFGVRVFDVLTNRGRRSFQMPLQDWPYLSKQGQVIFEDINSDIYILESFQSLDARTKKYLYTYVE